MYRFSTVYDQYSVSLTFRV